MHDLTTTKENASGVDFSRPVNLRLTVRNGILLQAIRLRAPSVAAFCRATGFSLTRAFEYIGFRRDPIGKDGNWRADAVRLCSLLDLSPEDGFPPEIASRVKRNTIEVFCAASEPYRPQLTPCDDASVAEIRRKVGAVLGTLTDRERYVLDRRFGLSGGQMETLEEIARKIGRKPQTVRQIEVKALRKLRHPSRARVLRAALDDLEEVV